jgi:formylglycine-generating enzyme required for sulfatase activity
MIPYQNYGDLFLTFVGKPSIRPSMYRSLLLLLISMLIIPLQGQVKSETPPEGMVLIPGGICLMGSDSHQRIASPKHQVVLNPFYMDTHEVSNKDYHTFCMETGYKLPEFWGMDVYKSGLDYPDFPVVGVSHSDASEYADWAGKRLPTEAEWEHAARGGLDDISYHFGEKADHSMARYNNPEAEKGPVKCGSFPPNDFGLYDMSGNAWEWVSDWFSESYYSESPEKNPPGPASGSFKVLRGGGWHSGGGCISVHRRNALPQHWLDMAGGFRCVKDLK